MFTISDLELRYSSSFVAVVSERTSEENLVFHLVEYKSYINGEKLKNIHLKPAMANNI
jgi:hypothetical protein